MKKEVIFVFAFVILISISVFAQSVSEKKVSEDVSNYIGAFLEKGGIENKEINEIKEVDKNSLPDEVEIKKIEDNNIGIYEVSYEKPELNLSQKLFVVTYSTKELAKKSDEVKNIQQLYFGYSGISNESGYLESAGGVVNNEDIGYVMMRGGSITGISTSLKLDGKGSVEIKVYKNGEDTGFSNVIFSDDIQRKDYDLQSEDIVKYYPGDVISVYVEKSGDVAWGSVVNIVETTSRS